MSYKTTATQLTADLQAWLEDDDAEFQGSIPEVINLGEMRLIRDLDLAIFDSTSTVTTAISNSVVSKPAGYTSDFQLGLRHMYITVANETQWLSQRSIDFVIDYIDGNDGLPKYYAESSLSEWRVAPTPDQVYTVNLTWRSRPDPLVVTSNESNWLSDNAADILFRACLAEAEAFLKSDDRKPVWEQDYAQRFPMAKKELYHLVATRYPELGMTPMPAPYLASP